MSNALSLESRVVAREGQVSSNLDGEVVILGLEKGVYYGLDNVGVRIWELIQQPAALADVKVELMNEFDVDGERCEKDLLALVGRLLDENLVEIVD